MEILLALANTVSKIVHDGRPMVRGTRKCESKCESECEVKVSGPGKGVRWSGPLCGIR